MWFQVYKLSLISLSRKINSFDRNVMFGLFLLLLMIQVTIYFQFSQSLTTIEPGDIKFIVVSLFKILGLGTGIGTLLILFINKEENIKAIAHMPISNSSINRAQAFPVLLTMIVFFLFETIAVLVSMFSVFDHVYVYMRFILAIVLFISFFVLLSFLFKKIGELLFLQRKFGYIFEILFVCLYMLGLIFWLLFSQQLNIAFGIGQFIYSNRLNDLIYLLLMLVITYGLIELLVFRKSPYYFIVRSLGKTYRLNLFKLSKFNGATLSLLQLLRNTHLLRSFIFSIVLGISLSFISLQLFYAENSLQHYQFLILCLGSHLSGVILYDSHTAKALKHLHVDYTRFLLEKVIFIFTIMLVTFNMCLVLISIWATSQLTMIELLLLNAQLLFYVAIMLFLSLLLNKFINHSKVLIGIVGLILYLISIEWINSIGSSRYLSMCLLVIITFGLTSIFVKGYAKRLLGVIH